MIETIALSAGQVETMNSDAGDWLRMTKEQEEFIRDTPRGFVPVFRERDIARVPDTVMVEAVKTAFMTAALAAITLLLGRKASFDDIVRDDLKIVAEPIAPGQRYLRVIATNDAGRQASGIGVIATPTAN